ncbi:acylneuraminate cytidylyltransferase [Paenibacillus sp. P3E]|uniref:acylneuraminate cytidylyltransferase family protein n=1 Tax=Paenibacillus sp. P3E TaxID=1349435 RepID=UPI000938E3D3|nr:acylneuraminate cytidylyltransferase family protein [Paenibacillus sp. P3E]OKP90595.1 acylneuraminate cytidylyltransferase [Paenibacillus sp. P3E]
MIDNKKVLAIIPARGGSKGIPRKNIKTIAGKPLIAWTIEEAKKSRYIDRLILSSEDSEIIEIARAYGCEVPFVRPKELSEDTTPGIDPVLHAINQLPNFDYVVLLQPTSPLRLLEDIDGCIENMVSIGAPACVSVTKTEKSPFWMYTLQGNKLLKPLIKQDEVISRRQDLPDIYALNGAVYVADINWLLIRGSFLEDETAAFVMPRNRSSDIDTEEDFFFCEYSLGRR